MKTAERWLSEYAKSHAHPTNQRLHLICVPLILWSLLVFLFALNPVAAAVVIGLSLAFYIPWGFFYFFGMFILAALSVASAALMGHARLPVKTTALAVFVAAWAGQFYGHKVEGKKPKFLQDVLFLWVGPAWFLAEIKACARASNRRRS